MIIKKALDFIGACKDLPVFYKFSYTINDKCTEGFLPLTGLEKINVKKVENDLIDYEKDSTSNKVAIAISANAMEQKQITGEDIFSIVSECDQDTPVVNASINISPLVCGYVDVGHIRYVTLRKQKSSLLYEECGPEDGSISAIAFE